MISGLVACAHSLWRGGRAGDALQRERDAVAAPVRHTLEEVIKWGHLVYLANGPVLLIRAEAERVLFGFWRGQRLRGLEPRLRAGGKYHMATIEWSEGASVEPATVRRLARDAVKLNEQLGDPTRVVR